jgi:peptide-methionine (R)-S-oxide reductase
MHSFFAKNPWTLPALAIVCGAGALWGIASEPPKTDDAKEGKETAKVTISNKVAKEKKKKMTDEPEYNKLSPDERWVILNKGTEYAFTGRYTDHFVEGTYICKRCNAPLYKSDSKFHSGCGWPAFDDEIKDSLKREVDADGSRIEIMCKNCGGHLGHVFNGERMTQKNTRHCVNSISIKFVPKGKDLPEVITAKKGEKEEELAKKESAKKGSEKSGASDESSESPATKKDEAAVKNKPTNKKD